VAYRPLEHTADVGLEVEAPTLDELFADAAAGLCDTVTERSRVEPRQRRETRLAAAALDLLLVEWLEELLFRLDAHRELYAEHHLTVSRAEGGWSLAAVSRGEAFDPSRHPLKVQVKAVTYHELEVVRAGSGWRARVLFDI
jgi:SHS2 domain-containing protein